MTKFLTSVKALLCVLLLSGSSFAGTVTGQVQTPSGGGFANATFSFTLTQPALVSGTATIAPATVNCYTDANGNVVGEPNPLVIPTVSANLASGTLGAATYFVKITYVDGTGQSVASPEGTLILSSTGTLVVTAPARQPTGATGYNVYISTSTGTETLQGTVTGTPGSWGNFSQASALGAGSALPGSNTTSCKLRFNDELQPSFVCYDVGLISSSGSTLPGYPQYWYLSGGTGGTVNIGVGTPQSTVCQGSGVSYPQSIVAQPIGNATQSISGGLDLGANPFSAGSGSFSGALSALRILGICDANDYPGSDGGAKINAAESDLNCVIVDATNLTSPTAAATVQATKPLYLGTYTFSLSGSPNINIGNHSCVYGRGRQSTILSTTSATADVLFTNPGNDYSCAQGVTIQSSVVRTAGAALHTQAGHGVFRDMLMLAMWDGIKADVAGAAGNNYYDSITMTSGGSGANWHCGILNGGVALSTVSGNFFHNLNVVADPTPYSDAEACIQDGSDGIAISDSQFVHGAGDSVAMHFERVNGGLPPEWIKCTNCYFEGGITKNSVVVDSLLTFDCFNCYAVAGLNGIVLNSGSYFHWHGGQIYLNQQNGVHIVNALDTQFIGVRFADNSQAITNTFDDVLVDANVNNFSFIGDTFATLESLTNRPKWNIEVSPGTSNNYYVTYNIMPGSAATGAISDSGTGPNKTVQSSVATDIGQNSIVQHGATSGTITVTPPAIAGSNTVTWPAATGTVGLSSGSQQWVFTCTGTATASSTLTINNAGVTTCTTAGANPTSRSAVAGTLSNLQVSCGTGGVNSSSGVFTVIANASGTSIACTIGTATSCSDTTHTAAIAAGQSLQLRYTTQAAETLANCTGSFVQQ